MADNEQWTSDELRCEEKCVYERVECEDALDGAAICITRERNCYDECD